MDIKIKKLSAFIARHSIFPSFQQFHKNKLLVFRASQKKNSTSIAGLWFFLNCQGSHFFDVGRTLQLRDL
jgi:hypothetical protein